MKSFLTATVALFVMICLCGAPFAAPVETAALALVLAAVWGCDVVARCGLSPPAVVEFLRSDRLSDKRLVRRSVGSLTMAWASAIALTLDRTPIIGGEPGWWLEWPVPCVGGALLGALVGAVTPCGAE